MSNRSRVQRISLISGGVVLLLLVLFQMGMGHLGAKYSLLHVSSESDYVDQSQPLGTCSVKTDGARCVINHKKSADARVGVGLGMSEKKIALKLEMDMEPTEKFTVKCSREINTGEQLVAYAIGTRHKYQIKREPRIPIFGDRSETSTWKYAFEPEDAAIYCEVQ